MIFAGVVGVGPDSSQVRQRIFQGPAILRAVRTEKRDRRQSIVTKNSFEEIERMLPDLSASEGDVSLFSHQFVLAT